MLKTPPHGCRWLYLLLFTLLPTLGLMAAEWEIISHFPAPPDENSQRQTLAANESRFFCYGGVEAISYSDDGILWHVMTTPTSHLTVNFEEVIYADGRFVAVDGSRHVLYSADGFNWSTVDLDNPETPETESYQDITYCDLEGQEQFLAVGPNGATAFSDTADPAGSWSLEQIAEKPDLHLVAWGEVNLASEWEDSEHTLTWMIAGRDSSASRSMIFYLSEGSAWSEPWLNEENPLEDSQVDYELTDITYDHNSGDFLIAATRTSETVEPAMQAGYFSVYDGRRLSAFNSHPAVADQKSRAGKFQIIDGDRFLQVHFLVDVDTWRSAFFWLSRDKPYGGYGYFHIVGRDIPKHFDFVSRQDKHLYLIDGNRIEFYESRSPISGSSYDLNSATQFSKFYTFPGCPLMFYNGYSRGLFSEDGTHWNTYDFTRGSSQPVSIRTMQAFQGRIYGSEFRGEMWSSNNLDAWQEITLLNTEGNPPATMGTHKDILLLGFEDGVIYRTLDGEHWMESESPLFFSWTTINSLHSTSEGFLYIFNDEVWRSPEGENWTKVVDRDTEGWAVAYGNDRVLFADNIATYAYNLETNTWQSGVLPEGSDITVFSKYHFYFSHGRFFLCTELDLWSSIDGVNWEQIASTPEGWNIPNTRPALTYYQQKVYLRYSPATLVSFPYAPDRVADWKKLHDLENSSDTEDGDGDGLTLLEEYALAKNPHKADVPENAVGVVSLDAATPETPEALAPPLQSSATESQYLTLTFDMRIDDPKLQYQVQETENIDGTDGWANGGVQVGYPLPLGPGVQRVTYRSTRPLDQIPNGYMRVVITRSAE